MAIKIESRHLTNTISENIFDKFAVFFFACFLTLSYVFSIFWAPGLWPDFKYHWGIRIFLPISLAFTVMRGWLPKTTFSRHHLIPISIGLLHLLVELLFLTRTSFEELYKSIQLSGLVGLWACICIYFLSKTKIQPDSKVYNNRLLWALLTTILVITYFSQYLSYDINADALISSTLICFLTNIVFIGLSEELAFRGVIQGVLERHWKGQFGIFRHANIITAILFSLIHNVRLNPEIFPWYLMLFPMGLFFGLLRDKTGTWLVPGIVHAAAIPIVIIFRAIDCKFVASCIASS
jgi:membrane protease YdiL (CAAX protease family)